MKKILCFILSIVLMFCLCIGLISCSFFGNRFGNNSNNENPSEEDLENKPFSIDLEGYVANIENAMALGISKKEKSDTSAAKVDGDSNSKNKLLSYFTSTTNKKSENKNYIVMSTTDYDTNAPEANGSGLTKVTFSKITTENATTELTGTKYIVAKDGKITINATNGFKYSISLNNKVIETLVADNGDSDKPNKKVFITFDNLTDGVEYKIDYRGIGVETTITQDDIEGEIDKLCVMNGYTFISFVPVGTSQRPESTQKLEETNNGFVYVNEYTSYDKTSYYSDMGRQSFVIDNSTGYIYPIKDITIQELRNNLLLINDLVYDCNIVDGNLNFFPLFTNETIEVKDFLKDKYGNKYIINNKLSVHDEATKTTYIKYALHQQFYLMPSNEILHAKDVDGRFEFRKFNEYGEPVRLSSSDNMDLNLVYRGSQNILFTRIQDGYVYAISNPYLGVAEFRRVNIENDYQESKSFGIYTGDTWGRNALNAVWIDDNHIVFYTDLIDGTGKIYTAQVWKTSGEEIDDPKQDGEFYSYYEITHDKLEDYLNRTDELKPVLLLENCIQEEYSNWSYSDWRISVSTLTETNYYKIAVIDGDICLVNERNYVSPEPQNYVLYPLNK